MPDPGQQASASRRSHFLAWTIDLLLVALFVAVILHPLAFGGRTLNADADWRDLNSLTQPSLVYSGKALARGDVPLWNPNWFAGYPHLAMPSAGVFYPTTILFGLFSFETAVKIVVLLHCYLAGAFSYLLGRSTFGLRLPALYFAFIAIAGDLVFPALRGSHIWSLQTLAWFPLALFFIDRICRNGRFGSALGLTFTVTLMIFGGDPQGFAFGLYFFAAYAAAFLSIALFQRRLALRDALPRVILGLLAIGLGLGLAAIQLIPSRELFAESVRAQGVSFEHISFFFQEPKIRVVESWIKDDGNWKAAAAARTMMGLAVAGLIFSRNAGAWSAFFAASLCMLYALMPRWYFDSVIQHLPVYSGVRGSVRMAGMAWWAVAYLGAFGVAAWTSSASQDRMHRGRIALITFVPLVTLSVLPALMGRPLPSAQMAACVAGAAGVVLVIAFAGDRRIWLLGCSVLIGASVAESFWKANTAGVWGDTEHYRVNPDFARFSASRMDMDRVALVFHPLALRHGSAVGLLTSDRILQGYHGLILSRHARVLDQVGGISLAPRGADGRLQDTQNYPDEWMSPKMLPLIDLFNVRYIVCVERRPGFSKLSLAQAQRFRAIVEGKFSVYENTAALPPVYPIHEVIACANDDEAIAMLRDGRIDYRKQITVTGAFDAAGLRATPAAEPVTIREYQPERIAVDAELSAPGVLVFSEMYYPGWKAYVDGSEREVLCVDTAFRGVRVEGGKHTIEMRYAPASLRIGATVSGASLLTILAISGGVLLHSRRRIRREGEITAV